MSVSFDVLFVNIFLFKQKTAYEVRISYGSADVCASDLKPLTKVPDPFGTHESFAHHNNAKLRAFLDRFGFDYEFYSATDCYQSGQIGRASCRERVCQSVDLGGWRILKQQREIANYRIPE